MNRFDHIHPLLRSGLGISSLSADVASFVGSMLVKNQRVGSRRGVDLASFSSGYQRNFTKYDGVFFTCSKGVFTFRFCRHNAVGKRKGFSRTRAAAIREMMVAMFGTQSGIEMSRAI